MSEITNFKTFEKEYNREFKKIIKSKIDENTWSKYTNLVNGLLKNVNIKNDEETYKIFEYLTLAIDKIYFLEKVQDKENLITQIYTHFKPVFTQDKILDNYLKFVKEIFTGNTYSHFNLQNEVLDILSQITNQNNKEEKVINSLKKALNKNESDDLALYLLKLIKKYHGKEEALKEAENYLYCPKVCDYLLEYYHSNPFKAKELLLKIIKKERRD